MRVCVSWIEIRATWWRRRTKGQVCVCDVCVRGREKKHFHFAVMMQLFTLHFIVHIYVVRFFYKLGRKTQTNVTVPQRVDGYDHLVSATGT